jgi:hypothetical protein
MNFNQFVEHMRQEIREEGFISSFNLASRIVLRLNERGLIDKISASQVMDVLECCDIHKEEFVISKFKAPRFLYYYNPNKER